jgi:DNA replication and repair protein RecF
MLLESLEVHHWRNLSGKLTWGSGLNILYGNNGQGKTNWLEAIYLLATTKSFRTARLPEAVKFGEDLAVVRGLVARSSEVHRELQVAIQGNTKSISINGKRESVARYLGQLQTIAFTADELEVVRGAPEARRKFLDRGVISLHHAYVQTVADYSRVLKQKNRLLQDAAQAESPHAATLRAALAPWNEQLVQLGTQIHHARVDYVARLGEALERRLFDREDLTIRYVSSFEGKGDLRDYETLFASRLELRQEAELSAGYALIGPHRDELEIQFDGRDIRAFGSSGQQRSALIILDLAAISVYYSWHHEYPLFLIDDIDAELDQTRIKFLLNYLEGRTQTFITTSKEGLIAEYGARAHVQQIIGGAGAETRLDEDPLTSSARVAESI